MLLGKDALAVVVLGDPAIEVGELGIGCETETAHPVAAAEAGLALAVVETEHHNQLDE